MCYVQGNSNVGPGKYNIDGGDFSAKSLAQKSSGPGWARQYYVSRQASMPHLLYQEQWKEKQEQVTTSIEAFCYCRWNSYVYTSML